MKNIRTPRTSPKNNTPILHIFAFTEGVSTCIATRYAFYTQRLHICYSIKFSHKDEACFTPNNFSFAVFFALVTR